jgi:hypothetical protein
MRVGLHAPDSKLPNLALMRLAAWHKEQGDEIVFPWGGAEVDKLYVSIILTENRQKVAHLAETAVIGGTGWDYSIDLPPGARDMRPDYDLYGIDYGVGFLYRGCVNKCPWCVVWRKEPEFKQVASIAELLNPKSSKLILLDNNLTAAPNVLDILTELAERKIQVNFNQALDIRRITPEIAQALGKVHFSNWRFTSKQVHFAWDSMGLEDAVRRGVTTLREAGIKPYRLMIYMLCGFNTTFEEDMYRFRVLRELGCDPYVMVYRDVEGKVVQMDPRVKHFGRWVNARIYKSCPWEEYLPAKKLLQTA